MIDLLITAVIHLSPADPLQDCTKVTPCYNGHQPSYSDPDCWPGAIWCDPAQTVGHGHGRGKK
jgi:hypothetical protein